MNPDLRVQDQLNTSAPTAPYIIGRELNLRKLPGRQWESNPQPSEQLRPMTIKKRPQQPIWHIREDAASLADCNVLLK